MTTGFIDNWHRIWSNRTPEGSQKGSVLQTLISIDGFDSPLGFMNEHHWKDYVAQFIQRSGIVQGDSVFEVGCGAGAFLYSLHGAGYEVSGIDYSKEQIQIAQSVMPQRKAFLNTTEASLCPINPSSDAVIANHVVHYFPSLTYSFAVIDLMLNKALKVVSISGIPNVELQNESENERRSTLSVEEYDSKYQGLEILYYSKDWFAELAKIHNFLPQFFDHDMPNFLQNRFRFDCVMTRI